MFSFRVYPTSSGTTYAASSGTYTWADELYLGHKWFDLHNFTLKVDISQSADSGQLNILYGVAEKSGTTFAIPKATANGTTLILTAGTSIGGANRNGTYLIPLTMIRDSGATKFLTGVPYIKFATLSCHATVPLVANLMVG